MKNYFIFIFLMFLSIECHSCLNGVTKVLKNGMYLYEDFGGNVPHGHNFLIRNDYKKELFELDSLYKKTNDLDYLSDKGILLIILKKYDEAINLYLEIAKLESDRYSTASNLGTAYELNGENKKALEWIEKSVKIDPKSHNNSEWIHVNILKAKLKGKEFKTSKFLLNTDFGIDTIPSSNLSIEELKKLSDALYFQLNERVSFIKSKNEIVSLLLFDLGNIAYLLGNYYDAERDYKKAKEYGYTNDLIDKRITENQKRYAQRKLDLEKERNKKIRMQNIKYGFIFIILFIVILLIVWGRKNQKNNS